MSSKQDVRLAASSCETFLRKIGLRGLDERTSCRYVQRSNNGAQDIRPEKRQACDGDLLGLELLPKRLREDVVRNQKVQQVGMGRKTRDLRSVRKRAFQL